MKNLRTFFLLVIVAACSPSYPPFGESTTFLQNPKLKPFYHSVASGDPMSTSVILWTRITPETQIPMIPVQWEISEDEKFQRIANAGVFETNPERDYTVKVEANNLVAGTPYYYRFKALGSYSPTGKTLTAPKNAAELKFGVVSCSNYEFGFFNAYGALADEQLNAIIHLGDYIYEYGSGRYGDTTTGRYNIPAHEIITLKDYRDRYSQYRLDPDLQAAHATHPFINIWDDHEISNDAYATGAQNHDEESEGPYETRKSAAVQTYYEWIPIRDDQTHYRKFSYGNLADLIMLDERLEARTRPASSLSDSILLDENHMMLGKTQLLWLQDQLDQSKAKWKIIGNQVIFSYLNWGFENFNINLDSWDGYPLERKAIADFIIQNQVENIVFITGDTHTAWAFEATHEPFTNYVPSTGAGAFAIELGTTSINSSNSNERYPERVVLAHEKKIMATEMNPHLKYTNMRDHGYLLLTLSEEKATATWKFMETLRGRNKSIKETKTIASKSGTNRLIVE